MELFSLFLNSYLLAFTESWHTDALSFFRFLAQVFIVRTISY